MFLLIHIMEVTGLSGPTALRMAYCLPTYSKGEPS